VRTTSKTLEMVILYPRPTSLLWRWLFCTPDRHHYFGDGYFVHPTDIVNWTKHFISASM